jgi:hypothetical protein
MHRRSACDPALESSRQRRQGELSQASIEVVHVEILMVAKTPGGPIKSVRLSLVLQRITQRRSSSVSYQKMADSSDSCLIVMDYI